MSKSTREQKPLSVRVLVPDGGELEEPEQEEESDEETEVEDAEGDGAEQDEEEEAEGDEDEEDERSEKIADEGTRLLHLNLDGLFLDLLGLEVDLDEVTLNLTASPGDGKLLGNLLSTVTGLLDSPDLGDLLGLGGNGEDGDGLLSGLMPDMPSLNPMERARSLAQWLAGKFRELLGNILDSIPLEDLLSQFLEELVSQLVNGGNGDEEASGS